MGEVADWILQGGGCEWCGVFLGSGEPGYPRLCGSCKRNALSKGFKVNSRGQITHRPEKES